MNTLNCQHLRWISRHALLMKILFELSVLKEDIEACYINEILSTWNLRI